MATYVPLITFIYLVATVIPMDKVPWILLVGGILLFFGGAWLGAAIPGSFVNGDSFVSILLISSLGAFMATVGFIKLRRKFNRWLDE